MKRPVSILVAGLLAGNFSSAGVVFNNYGTVFNNWGTVVNNSGGTVVNNHGTVERHDGGWILNNEGFIQDLSGGSIYLNRGRLRIHRNEDSEVRECYARDVLAADLPEEFGFRDRSVRYTNCGRFEYYEFIKGSDGEGLSLDDHRDYYRRFRDGLDGYIPYDPYGGSGHDRGGYGSRDVEVDDYIESFIDSLYSDKDVRDAFFEKIRELGDRK